jgi:FkbM family methyltransferase
MHGTPTQADVAPPLHHPAILAQQPVTTWRTANIDVDFIGTRTRRSRVGMTLDGEAGQDAQVTPAYPSFDEEYFEWVDVLESVEAATDTFVMIELGAGYGRWSMRAALAARRKPGCRFHCVAVEAEPDHFRWMVDHFTDNGVDPSEHDLIWAAVGARPGFVPFWIGDAGSWYGQSVPKRAPVPLPDVRTRRRLKARSVLGRPPAGSPGQREVVWVPCVSLSELLAPYPRVDLIDIDVQGAEVSVLFSAIELLNERVRRIHVGTHSAEIERDLRGLFSDNGWKNLNDYPCLSRAATPYGEIEFGDGVQTWLNPVWPPLPRARTRADNSAEASRLIALLRTRVTELEALNRQLKADKRQVREQRGPSQKGSKPKTATGWPQRLVPRWFTRLSRRRG